MLLPLYQSHYRAHWRGICISLHRFDKNIATFIPIFDQHDNPMRKRIIRRQAWHWMTFAGHVDSKYINSDWLVYRCNEWWDGENVEVVSFAQDHPQHYIRRGASTYTG